MPTRSRTERGLRSASGFALAVVLVATLVGCAHARAPKPPDDVALVDEHATRNPLADNPPAARLDERATRTSPVDKAPPAALDEPRTSVFVRANFARSEPWVGFRVSVADAAVPKCLDPDAARHGPFVAQGLLRAPFLLNAAAEGACR
jgi:hypothetical protein